MAAGQVEELVSAAAGSPKVVRSVVGAARALDVPLITRDALLQELRGLKCVW